MNELELQARVRAFIAERVPVSGAARPEPAAETAGRIHPHASHATFTLLASGEDGADGPCLIEATVRCNHCGYCKSYGH
jgi:hypothetical protein